MNAATPGEKRELKDGVNRGSRAADRSDARPDSGCSGMSVILADFRPFFALSR
jgi:hypothetical protein